MLGRNLHLGLRAPGGNFRGFRCHCAHLSPHLGLRARQQKSCQKPKNYRGVAPHLGLHHIPGNFLERRRRPHRLRCGLRLGPAPRDEVIRILPAPLRLLPLTALLLAIRRRACVLPCTHARVGLEPPPANRTRSFPGHPAIDRHQGRARNIRKVALQIGAPPVPIEPPPRRRWLTNRR